MQPKSSSKSRVAVLPRRHALVGLRQSGRRPAFFLFRRRPYRDEYTGSLPNSEVNRCRARLVLDRGTVWEALRVLRAFYFIFAHGRARFLPRKADYLHRSHFGSRYHIWLTRIASLFARVRFLLAYLFSFWLRWNIGAPTPTDGLPGESYICERMK